MPIAFYLAPYRRRVGFPPARYCAMDDFSADIFGSGGAWTESEVLGDRAVVKVRASASVLATIDAAPGFVRMPKDAANDSLSGLNTAQKVALRSILTDMGYPLIELQAVLGADLGARTLGDVLRFMASRRRKPRYDAATDTIVLDGEVVACRHIDTVDAEVG